MKGKAEPIAVWEAVEPVARFGLELASEPTTPLVGRKRELELLRSITQRVREERSTQLVTLVGVPGIGKSRLVGELARIVEAEPEPTTWRQGRCLPYGEHVTYWALGEILKAEAGILETDDFAEAEAKLSRAVSSAAAAEADAPWLGNELRTLVGLSAEPSASAEAATGAWRRFLEAMAERRPTVLVFEDLHWADDGLLDFVDDLVDRLRDVPLLVVGTTRPELLERRPGWGGGKANSTTISLQPLREQETAELVASLLDRPLQLAEEQQALLERVGGNPLFAEQYVRMVAERGTAGELPESVQGVIAARLDALPAEEKSFLHEAAVHGKDFWASGVAAAAATALEDAERRLRALERKDFVKRRRTSTGGGDTQYAFQHALLRDVAYGQIPRRERGEKHRRAAQWIEGLGRPDDNAGLIAHHYSSALELLRAAGAEVDPELVDRTVDALRAAGERALALSALPAAEEFTKLALALVPSEDVRRPRLLVLLTDIALRTGSAARDLAAEALERFSAAGDAEGATEAATVGARIAWFEGDRAECDRLIGIALETVADRSGSRARALALSHQTGFFMLGGAFEEAIETGAEAFRLAEALGMTEQQARAHIVVGCARCCLGDTDGLHEIRRGIELADAEGHVEMAQIGYGNLSSELHFLGRLEEARAAWQEELTRAERYGLGRVLRSARLGGAAWAYVDGRWDETAAIADELVAAAEHGDRDYSDAMAYSLRAWIRLARGDAAGADADSERAVEHAKRSDAQAQAAGYTVGALIAAARGRHQDGDRLADELAAIGPVVVAAMCAPFPTLVDTAWAFHDLGRGADFTSAILDPSPIASAWNEAARAIVAGEPGRAADIVAEIGNPAATAYARLRASERLAEAGRLQEAFEQRALADAFYRPVQARGFLADLPPAAAEAAD